ncbi:hypothetical protein Phab24_id031 [Acinetobacter phage Phab24]|nr:hypothetical protein Phab24_id031 [Acinetobacter phage Phab24]
MNFIILTNPKDFPFEWFYVCQNCGTYLPISEMNPKDFGICSIDCGMEIRGLSYRDFV